MVNICVLHVDVRAYTCIEPHGAEYDYDVWRSSDLHRYAGKYTRTRNFTEERTRIVPVPAGHTLSTRVPVPLEITMAFDLSPMLDTYSLQRASIKY